MFIAQGFTKDNHFLKYLLGSLIVFLASVIGQLPLIIAIAIQLFFEGGSITSLNSTSIMKVLDLNLNLFLILFSFFVALVALYFVVTKLHNQQFLAIVTSRKKTDWSRIFFSFGIWATISIISMLGTYYLSPDELVWNFKPLPFLLLFIIAVVMIPLQTTAEELVFRGYLMQGFGNLSGNKWFPLLMTSLIFGGMHILNPEVGKMGYIIMVYYIGTGLFLGILTLMDEGMELALGFHAANNLIGVLLITSDWSAFQTHSVFRDVAEPSASYDVIFPVLIIFPILLFIFSKKYKWMHWKDKLTGNITYADNPNHIQLKNDDFNA